MDIVISDIKPMPTQGGISLLVRFLRLMSGTGNNNSRELFAGKGSGAGDRKQWKF